MNSECDLIAVAYESFFFLDISNEFFPIQKDFKAIGGPAILNPFQILTLRNRTVLVIIGPSYEYVFDSSNLTIIRFVVNYFDIQKQPFYLTGAVVLNDEIIMTRRCVPFKDRYIAESIFYNISTNEASSNELIFSLNPLVCKGNGNSSRSRTKMKSMENEFYYYIPEVYFFQKNTNNSEKLFLNSGGVISEIQLLQSFPEYKILFFQYFFTILKKIPFDSTHYPYTISESQKSLLTPSFFYRVSDNEILGST